MWDLTNGKYIRIFFWSFKIMYLNAWGQSLRLKHAACIDRTNKEYCGWLQQLWFLVNCQRDTQFFTMYLFLFLFLTLHVSSTSCSSSEERNCVNTTSGNCHSVYCRWPCHVQVGSFTSDLHTARPPTQSDSYQRLCWHNLSLLMMSTMCSKHVELKIKIKINT
jgi:hypothetical protein